MHKRQDTDRRWKRDNMADCQELLELFFFEVTDFVAVALALKSLRRNEEEASTGQTSPALRHSIRRRYPKNACSDDKLQKAPAK